MIFECTRLVKCILLYFQIDMFGTIGHYTGKAEDHVWIISIWKMANVYMEFRLVELAQGLLV